MSWKRLGGFLALGLLAGGAAAWFFAKPDPLLTGSAPGSAPDGMVWIRGGKFQMGTNKTNERFFADAGPVHEVSIRGFWMDQHELTNAKFAEFVNATGYVTIAERKPDKAEIMSKRPKNLPPLEDEAFVPGSLVFVQPSVSVDWRTTRQEAWWQWVPGACWKHPEGPGSDLKDRDNHPVVHVCWDDAVAYCQWAGKRLSTEAEWEYAARGGLDQKAFVWGDEEPEAGGKCRCNKWQGVFPHENSKQDGYVRTAPVGSYEPNGFGLYDMAGNVWEWCSDWYQPDYYKKSPPLNPTGPEKSADPERGMNPARVQRGGSFLCSAEFCSRYKPAGRGRNDPLTGQSHVGFRCVKDVAK